MNLLTASAPSGKGNTDSSLELINITFTSVVKATTNYLSKYTIKFEINENEALTFSIIQ